VLQRYYKPDPDKIEALLIRHGLTVNDLADRAGIDRRTLARMAKKKEGILMSTLSRIADAFNVQPKALLPGNSEDSVQDPPLVTVKIELGISKKIFTEQAQTEFVQLLKTVLRSTSQINLVSVVEGSTIVFLEMCLRDAVRLVYLATSEEGDESPYSRSERSIASEVSPYKRGLYIGMFQYRVKDDAKLFHSTTKGDLRKYEMFKITLHIERDIRILAGRKTKRRRPSHKD
jgi:transcriptional regulator with XRE-family HTH domain